MLSYIIPTRDRAETLARTLSDLGDLPAHDAEVIVIDNASSTPVVCPRRLSNGVPVAVQRMDDNLGAAARNHGARSAHASSRWLIMLDDDSSPLDAAFMPALERLGPGVAAASADIVLTNGQREQGGLPEVFVGCGVAIRTDVFKRLGGYDESFGYYAEEYDLAARLILDGLRVEFLPAFRVEHRKCMIGRNFSRIARNLVRNNCRVAFRYAPHEHHGAEIRAHLSRYARIARKERAILGYLRGVGDLLFTRDNAIRTPMSQAQWDRFTGAAACRRYLSAVFEERRPKRIALVDHGKNAAVVESVVKELGVRVIKSIQHADALVIATLSPGPMLDAMARWRAMGRLDALASWNVHESELTASVAA